MSYPDLIFFEQFYGEIKSLSIANELPFETEELDGAAHEIWLDDLDVLGPIGLWVLLRQRLDILTIESGSWCSC